MFLVSFCKKWNSSKSVFYTSSAGMHAETLLTGESGSVFELADLQHALAVLAVQDVRRRDVVQGVVLQRRGGRVELGAEGERVGGAVAGSGADGADPFGGRLHGHGRTFVEAVLFTPERRRSLV